MRLCRAAVQRARVYIAAWAGAAFVGASAWTARMRDAVGRLATTRPGGVLVTGEPGAGKTHLARVLHLATGRATFPCLVYACGTSPYASVDLFGAAPLEGGLVGAVQGGTLILDHVERVDVRLQERLVDWADRRARATGGVPFLVGATTTARRDTPLLDWLGQAALGVLPLRDRTADIEPLARQCAGAVASCRTGRARRAGGRDSCRTSPRARARGSGAGVGPDR